MTDLTAHLQDYLRLRRALGFQLDYPGHALPTLVSHLEAAGSATITTELAIEWARLPQDVQPLHWAHRLSAARGFARYLQTVDPATEVPPRDVFGARQQRPTCGPMPTSVGSWWGPASLSPNCMRRHVRRSSA